MRSLTWSIFASRAARTRGVSPLMLRASTSTYFSFPTLFYLEGRPKWDKDSDDILVSSLIFLEYKICKIKCWSKYEWPSIDWNMRDQVLIDILKIVFKNEIHFTLCSSRTCTHSRVPCTHFYETSWRHHTKRSWLVICWTLHKDNFTRLVVLVARHCCMKSRSSKGDVKSFRIATLLQFLM